MTSKRDQRVEQDERDVTYREDQRQADQAQARRADQDLAQALDRSERARVSSERAVLEAKPRCRPCEWLRGLFGR